MVSSFGRWVGSRTLAIPPSARLVQEDDGVLARREHDVEVAAPHGPLRPPALAHAPFLADLCHRDIRRPPRARPPEPRPGPGAARSVVARHEHRPGLRDARPRRDLHDGADGIDPRRDARLPQPIREQRSEACSRAGGRAPPELPTESTSAPSSSRSSMPAPAARRASARALRGAAPGSAVGSRSVDRMPPGATAREPGRDGELPRRPATAFGTGEQTIEESAERLLEGERVPDRLREDERLGDLCAVECAARRGLCRLPGRAARRLRRPARDDRRPPSRAGARARRACGSRARRALGAGRGEAAAGRAAGARGRAPSPRRRRRAPDLAVRRSRRRARRSGASRRRPGLPSRARRRRARGEAPRRGLRPAARCRRVSK